MFKNYLKTSVRSIFRNPLFSAINIVGLAISMSICLLTISFIAELYSYDKFHPKADRIYRVISEEVSNGNSYGWIAGTSVLTGKRLQEEAPGIEALVIMNRKFNREIIFEDKMIPMKGLWASEDFFKVFEAFPLLKGNPETALAEPKSVVLTDESATKLFGSIEPMGKLVEVAPDEFYTVTGVIEKPPFNSHIDFEILASMITYENQRAQSSAGVWPRWMDTGNDFVYMLLEENSDPSNIDRLLQEFGKQENVKSERWDIHCQLQAISSIIPGRQLSNNIGKSIDPKILWALSLLTFIIILCASFNYTNLSIARSLRRAKEVGVRKVVGASKRQVFQQFILESMLVSIIALVFATLLFHFIRPMAINLSPDLQQLVRLETTPSLLAYFLVFSILVGLMAGLFPALFLAKFQAIAVLKGSGAIGRFRKLNARKVLVVIQFSLSLIFLITSIIIYKQYRYSVAFDLGFKTENILNVELQGNDADKVSSSFAGIPEIDMISKSMLIPGLGGSDGTYIKFDDPNDSTRMSYNFIDENYIPLMKHELLAGSNFESRRSQQQEESIILNEKLIKRLGIGTPQEAIGQQIQMYSGNKLTIIGVVKDFTFQDVTQPIGNFGFRYAPGSYNFVNLNINSQDLIGTMAKIDEAWKNADPVRPIQAEFYDRLLREAYAPFSAISKVTLTMTVITISIAVLGLFGMAIYSAETRVKEASIRKIMGASESKIIMLLTRGFMLLLFISVVIAIPVSYFLLDSVILAQSTNRVAIGMLDLFGAVILILSIGFITISSQTWRVARSNPVDALRAE